MTVTFLQVKRMTESNTFNGIIIFIILLNAIMITMEISKPEEELSPEERFVYIAVDQLFLAIYTVEFVLKIYAEPKNYWKSTYNLFDFIVLAISYIQVTLSLFRVLHYSGYCIIQGTALFKVLN